MFKRLDQYLSIQGSCEILANDLMQYHGVPAVRIHGDMAQYERSAALEAGSGERLKLVLVCVCLHHEGHEKAFAYVCIKDSLYGPMRWERPPKRNQKDSRR